MKKILKCIFVLVLLFAFSFSVVHAAEIENENNNANQEVETDKQEETNENEEEEEEKQQEADNSQGNTVTTITDENELTDSTNNNELDTENENPTEDLVNEKPSENLTDDNEATTKTDNNNDDEETYDYQKVKVFISKVDSDGNALAGALLQLKDSTGEIIAEWTSTEEDYIIFLSDGTYTLHEEKAPNGYEIAQDKEFTVKLLHDLDSGVDFVDFPCPDYGGTPMYYVEIEGEKQEVYCINQGWETPDGGSTYDGEVITPENVRDFTKQTVPVDISSQKVSEAIMSDEPIDISDPTLTDEQLYNKLLNIIYHRQKAQSVLAQRGLYYSTEEIRFITEVALKNYTNAGITELQFNIGVTQSLLDIFDANGIVYKRYKNNSNLAEDENGAKLSYLKHNYRDYVYTPDVPLGSDIVITSYGNGNSFGQMVAGHFNYRTRYLTDENGEYVYDANGNRITVVSHNAKNNPEEREQVARYYELFLYLISDDDTHPDDMNLYVYSSESIPSSSSSNDHDGRYQNLLGITGYYEISEQQTLEVVMEDDYSEKRDITVQKVWDDKENYSNARPKNVTIELYADNELIDTVEIDETLDWTYTWRGLNTLNEEGNKIEYTVKEKSVDGYSMEITGDMTTVFVVTNSYEGTGGDDPENPKTADPIVYYVITFVISLFGMIGCMYTYKKI